MTIFGNSRLGRIGYAIVLLLMFAFDFAKGPIEHSIMAMHDQAADELMKPHAVENFDPNAGKINGLDMPLMLKGQEDAIREIARSPHKFSRQQMEEKFLAATARSMLTFETNHPANPEVKRLAEARSFYATLFPIAVIIMTGITIVGLLWMVSSRLRDIGWPQFLLWVLLTPIFLPKFLHIPLSAAAAQGTSLFFYAVIFALAFIPGQDSRGAPPVSTELPRPTNVRQRPDQFGRLGTR